MTFSLKPGSNLESKPELKTVSSNGFRHVILVALLAFGSLTLCSSIQAENTLELEETSIRGASELPKVLYIVPWKKLEPDDKPVKLDTMVDEIMSPVDMEILRRQVHYYNSMQRSATDSK